MSTAFRLPSLETIKNIHESVAQVYISTSNQLYISDMRGNVWVFDGPDFRSMSEEEIGDFLISQAPNLK